MVFDGYSGFLHHIQLATHELATFGINVTKNKKLQSNYLVVNVNRFTENIISACFSGIIPSIQAIFVPFIISCVYLYFSISLLFETALNYHIILVMM